MADLSTASSRRPWLALLLWLVGSLQESSFPVFPPLDVPTFVGLLGIDQDICLAISTTRSSVSPS